MNHYRPLHDGWTVAPVAPRDAVPPEVAERTDPVPATVPGCVHTDLLAADLICDPFLDDNERDLAWIGRTDWRYETRFEWPDEERPAPGQVDLVCEGLDTVARIEVNGHQVAATANMHRRYRFPVTSLLRAGENQLGVHFTSAYQYAEGVREELGDRPGPYHPEPYPFIRKMACNFGWDWGPNVVTAGIWRQIGLHRWHTARLDQVRPQVTVAGGEGRVDLQVSVIRAESAAEEPVTVTAVVRGPVYPGWDGEPGQRPAALDGQRAEVQPGHVLLGPTQRHATVTLAVRDPARWWPRGYGDQPLYELEVQLHDRHGEELDRWQRRIGFRSVRLDTTSDADGTPYTLVVNGVPVFVRGVNWIPDDAFVTRVTRQRYAQRLDQACEANLNLLRVWGGGIYESADFYELCDEKGLLVAQDFLFACAAYPEESPVAEEVAAEARDNVLRLAHHPSLVTWTGNNENIWGWHDWDWQPQLRGRSWGAKYYFETLPQIVAELDPTRPYWPGSPYSGTPHRHPNEPGHGSMHIWDVWNDVDYTHYRSYTPRFVAEFGWQAPPAYATLRRAISDQPLASDSPGMRHHQKARDGDGKLWRGLRAHLPAPRDFDDWHWYTQLTQARAITVGVEHFRSLRPVCMGAIVWQLNDCWPVTSWAAIDGDGRRKPLWYALRRMFADRLLTIQPREEGLVLVAVNESAEPWSTEAVVTRMSLAGEPLAKHEAPVTVAPRSAVTLPLPAPVASAGEPIRELLLATAGEERAWWFFAEDVDLAYPTAEYDAVVSRSPAGTQVTVTARTLLRELTLFPDRLDPAAEVDEALVTLLPGESATFTITGVTDLDETALTEPPVLRCTNDFPS
ncbi:glycoside hydrolase family 2 protein [Natronosporangium hydrolyticum]|uniref:beta-mannosidase n=1 Tax=Natronosporangium hydrolyticum TaxID=2811111 RepID=A0A895Y7A2_9ACTN|nr:glycoside hydrolase family 2 TIM barrel-domain containing protein [Natronosporangium hydrolyticum]QSB13614.1 glycoside hydrolase family 2 protein [Natronosporangium hydrolyticum]